jgi:hypothetical protein
MKNGEREGAVSESVPTTPALLHFIAIQIVRLRHPSAIFQTPTSAAWRYSQSPLSPISRGRDHGVSHGDCRYSLSSGLVWRNHCPRDCFRAKAPIAPRCLHDRLRYVYICNAQTRADHLSYLPSETFCPTSPDPPVNLDEQRERYHELDRTFYPNIGQG